MDVDKGEEVVDLDYKLANFTTGWRHQLLTAIKHLQLRIEYLLQNRVVESGGMASAKK